MNVRVISREIVSVHAAALILGGAALISKLLGLARDRLLASLYGAGDALDAYYAAFQIPDFLYTLLLIGAASAAVLPVFIATDRRSRAAAERFIANLITLFALGSFFAAIAVAVAAPLFLNVVAPGFPEDKLRETVFLTRIIVFNVIPLGIAGILASALQARRRFVAFALPPVVYNVGIIVGILFLVPHPWAAGIVERIGAGGLPSLGLAGIAAGVLFGGLLQVLVQIPSLASAGIRVRPRIDFSDPGLRAVMRTAAPRVLALSLTQLTLIALAAIASYFASGSVATFRLAANLLFVPVGLFGVSYALAEFPRLAGAWAGGATLRFADELASGFRNILFWALPTAALMIVLRAHIVRVILGAGAFDWQDTRLVAALLGAMAVAIISESVLPLILRAFYAMGRTREPLAWDLAGSAVTVGSAFGLTALFLFFPDVLRIAAELFRIGDIADPHVLAVALGFVIGSLANAGLLVFALRRSYRAAANRPLRLGRASLIDMAAGALAAGLAGYAALIPFPALVDTRTFLGIALQGVAAGAAGFAVYFVILAWRRNAEAAALAESFRSRLITPRKTPQVYDAEQLDGEVRR